MYVRILLFLMLTTPVWGAEAQVTLTLDDAYVPAFREYLLLHYPAADADSNGTLTGAELVAWLNGRAQNMLMTFALRSVEWAEETDPTLLPQTHQDALTVKQAGDTALETERAKITP